MADEDYSTEEWRDIPGYEGYYQASSRGRIRSLDRRTKRTVLGRVQSVKRTGKILSPCESMGYFSVNLERPVKVHRLVCMAFHGLPLIGQEVLHGDGTRTNNSPENLRWGTRSENIKDGQNHGTIKIGAKHKGAKLNDDQVREIRVLLCNLDLSTAAIADMYGVASGTVSQIGNGRAWRHVEPFYLCPKRAVGRRKKCLATR